MRLALLPPISPSPWWTALLSGLVERTDVDLLWVAQHAPADPRVAWLPLGPVDGEAVPAADPVRPPADSTPGPAAMIVDVGSPRAGVVAPLGRELTLLAVLENPAALSHEASSTMANTDWAAYGLQSPPPPPPPPGGLAQLDVGLDHDHRDALALVEMARLIICSDVAVSRTVPEALQPIVRLVPRGVAWSPELELLERPAIGTTPTVAVIGGALSDEVRLAWARLTETWPDAILLGDLDELDGLARTRLLRGVHVVVVLDSSGDHLAEAMGSGATVIAHGDAYAASLITHATNGLLTDGRAPDLLAATLAYAIGYHEQLAPLREASQRQARARMSADTLADRVIELVEVATRVDDATTAPPLPAAGADLALG